MIKELEKYEVKYLFVVIDKSGKSIGIKQTIYPLSRIYFLFVVSLIESWIDGQSDELITK